VEVLMYGMVSHAPIYLAIIFILFPTSPVSGHVKVSNLTPEERSP
jgi:hypothetical protein